MNGTSRNPNRRITVQTGRLEGQPTTSVAEDCSTLRSCSVPGAWLRLGADPGSSSGCEITGAHHDLAEVIFTPTESNRQVQQQSVARESTLRIRPEQVWNAK